METTQDTMTLGEARQQLQTAIDNVVDAATDHRESDTSPDAGTWVKSQTYAMLLLRLQTYNSAQRIYDRVLAERLRRS